MTIHTHRVVFTALAVLALPLVASADRRDREREREQPRIQELAHQLEDAADHAAEVARSGYDRDDRSERAAVKALENLAKSARHFHQEVERRGESPRHLRGDFAELTEDYDRARDRIDALHHREPRREFRRVSVLLAQLAAGYEFQEHSRWHRHGDDDCNVAHDDHHGRERSHRRYVWYRRGH